MPPRRNVRRQRRLLDRQRHPDERSRLARVAARLHLGQGLGRRSDTLRPGRRRARRRPDHRAGAGRQGDPPPLEHHQPQQAQLEQHRLLRAARHRDRPAVDPLVEQSRIHNCGGGNGGHDHAIYTEFTRRAVIRNNYLYDNPGFGISMYPDTQNALIEHNVIDGNGYENRGNVTFSGEEAGGEYDRDYASTTTSFATTSSRTPGPGTTSTPTTRPSSPAEISSRTTASGVRPGATRPRKAASHTWPTSIVIRFSSTAPPRTSVCKPEAPVPGWARSRPSSTNADPAATIARRRTSSARRTTTPRTCRASARAASRSGSSRRSTRRAWRRCRSRPRAKPLALDVTVALRGANGANADDQRRGDDAEKGD